MPKAGSYSDEDRKTINRMRNEEKASWEDIAAAIGRNAHAITMKYYSMRAEAKAGKKTQIVVRKARAKGIEKHEEQHAPAQRPKPMIALIGDTLDVTKTIKELFS